MNNKSIDYSSVFACTHPPGPLLLQAKEGGEMLFSPSLRSREGLG